MDYYQRIQKKDQHHHHQQQQLSPKKLRSMLLGVVEKKRKQENEQGEEEFEELESSAFSLRSQHESEIHDSGGSSLENCKDVDVVSELPECSTSTRGDSLSSSDLTCDSRLKNHNVAAASRMRSSDETSLDYDSGVDSMSISSSSVFEFQKAERAAQRVPLAPFSKPAPSKWDDAQKWIASPTSNRPKTGQGGIQGAGSRKPAYFGYGSRQPPMKVVVEVPDQGLVPYDEPDTKQIDSGGDKKVNDGHKFVEWGADPCPITESYGKPVMMENRVGGSAINLSRHDSSVSVHSATTFLPPPSTARSVSMRDMGTEMTPIASQEPSRTGTPVRATTPTRSPTSSQPSSPGRAVPDNSPTRIPNDNLDLRNGDLSEKELQMKTRREIMVLGTQLGKMNIAAWASKEGDSMDTSSSLENNGGEPAKSVIETRAAAWEESEKAKYMARFKREEIKIQAWENHQKAKSEAEMRKLEVEVERMRVQAHDKLMNKLAAIQHKAEVKRAAADAKRNRQAARTEEQADYIRRTGRIPSSCCHWCF